MTGPIANFEPENRSAELGLPPALIRQWVHDFRPCAIYWGGSSFNGYALLPPESPLFPIADAHDIVAKAQATYPTPENTLGYDGLIDMIANVHGSLTYGPDEQGWVGFDTGHAGDLWDDAVIEAELQAAGAVELLTEWTRMRQMMGDMWPPARIGGSFDERYGRRWTIEALVEETNSLAEQLVNADDALRQVKAILG